MAAPRSFTALIEDSASEGTFGPYRFGLWPYGFGTVRLQACKMDMNSGIDPILLLFLVFIAVGIGLAITTRRKEESK